MFIRSSTKQIINKRFFLKLSTSNLKCLSILKENTNSKINSHPLVYIAGEEMSRHCGELFLNELIRPYCNINHWEFYDLSCKSRDDSNDKVLYDCIAAGKRIGSIYKEPTITPTGEQAKLMNLKKVLSSPNGLMRKGWNGISISRDTIHLPGMVMGYKNKCLFDRHAVGGEYAASYAIVGKGTSTLTFKDSKNKETIIDSRKLTDDCSAIVTYDNPYDNVYPMAHHFFSRCLEAKVTPYVTTKKTVFKWQEKFWLIMKEVFDKDYKLKFQQQGLLDKTNGELCHFLSDVATMHIIRWSDGNWGMASHNYDGDVLTDEIAQVHRSPGFLTSVLNGINEDGSIIKEFEASHDMWNAHLRGEETSLNPLSMMEALIGAMQHSCLLQNKGKKEEEMSINDQKYMKFCRKLRQSIHLQMISKGTRDLHKDGLTTVEFVKAVRKRIEGTYEDQVEANIKKGDVIKEPYVVDIIKMKEMFNSLDTDSNGSIDFNEFSLGMKKLGIAPKIISSEKHL